MENEITACGPPVAASQPQPKSTAASSHDLDLANDMESGNLKFAFSRHHLQRLINLRSISLLHAYGGLSGLAAGLQTDTAHGLSLDEDILEGPITLRQAITTGKAKRQSAHLQPEVPIIASQSSTRKSGSRYSDRRAAYGENRLPPRTTKSIWQLAWIAFNDKLMFLLTASATVSLTLGIYQTVTHSGDGARIEWVEGVAIVIAILLIVSASALNDFQKDRKFARLNSKKDERFVTVIRSGKQRKISVFDILVGDLVHLEAGDLIPTDGVLVQGFAVQCDESSSSGEADLVDKTPVTESSAATPNSAQNPGPDPFILSGAKVASGIGKYLVTATGADTGYGRILISLRNDVEETPLQQKLAKLAKYIVNFGLTAGAIFFAITFIRFLVQLKDIQGGSREKGEEFLDILILAITVVVIAVPEGLPLAVTLALAFATTRMLRDNNLVRLLRSCEIMGNATTICSDKTGTLTQNKMSVVSGIIGAERFEESQRSSGPLSQHIFESAQDFLATISDQTKELLRQSIALNSTAFEREESGVIEFVGSSTETALLNFGREHLDMGSLNSERESLEVVQLFPFDPSRKCMVVVTKMPNGLYRMLAKGAAEVVVDRCTTAFAGQNNAISISGLDEEMISNITSTIGDYASRSLRPIAMAYREFDCWPPKSSSASVEFDTLFKDLCFIGVFGIRDPLRPEVVESVRQCQAAGVFVRMVTGDNFQTAKAIAQECGIYTPGGIAMDGPTFRKLSPAQLDLVIPRLQVLARSNPEDKMMLVTHLKSLKETVAVTGDGTNDALALKAADVGLAMGLSGTEVAKEASSIIIMDDNFSSILKALLWGRTVNDAAKKFIQFQFTINFSAGILTIVSVLVGGNDESIFTVVQLLWINLIMDTFAALALATDYPTKDLLQRKPEPRTAPILSMHMWKMIIGQAIYQLIVTFTLHYAGPSIFSYQTELQLKQLQTLIFNTYVWMQFFNQTNSRRVDNNLNVFEGTLKNPWFLGVQAVTLAGQVVIIFKGGQAFETQPLTGAQWAICLVLGVITLPIGTLIRLIPDKFIYCISTPVKRLYQKMKLSGTPRGEDDNARWWKLSQFRHKLVRPFHKYKKTKSQRPILPTNNVSRATLELTQSCRGVSGQQQTMKVSSEFDMVSAIDSARDSSFDGLEVHPDTSKEDPIIMEEVLNREWPPSQNPALLQYFRFSDLPPSCWT